MPKSQMVAGSNPTNDTAKYYQKNGNDPLQQNIRGQQIPTPVAQWKRAVNIVGHNIRLA